MNVVLIGFSGTGKSSVGRILARQIGWEFVDTDAEVERTAGKRIHEIFAEEGEEAFRRLEREALREALSCPPRVVAVGGGAVVDPANRALLREGNLVVLLEAGVDAIHARLARAAVEEPRPMLGLGVAGGSQRIVDPRARIGSLKAARDPHYREIAGIVVATDETGVEEVARLVAKAVERHLAAPGGPGEGSR